MAQHFYSNGKLLLTGEYVVLDGALSLAIPTTYGQSMTVEKIDAPKLVWKSFDDENHVWFEETFDLNNLQPTPPPTSVAQKGLIETLWGILNEAKNLNPKFLSGKNGFHVETRLSFPRNWGLGTSSTLINNIAQWAEVNAYELLWNSFSGSGYDIACAQNNTAILYQLKDGRPAITPVDFNPPFADQLYFVYLNKKQNSREAISQYKKQEFNTNEIVGAISQITKEIKACTTILQFEQLVAYHENLLSDALKTPTVKASLFPEYNGAMKSLGPWGGDFILVTGDGNTPKYFKEKGYTTVVPYSKMAL